MFFSSAQLLALSFEARVRELQAEAVANGKEFTADTQYFRCRSEVSKSSQESGPLIDDLNIEIEPSVVQNYVQDTEQSSKNETEVRYF